MRSAQRVQPEQRIRSRDQRHLGDGVLGNQIPAHHVAERLILPHAVNIDRNPFRRAEQRRRRVAAEIHVGLKGIARHFVDVNAVQLARFMKIAQIERAAVFDIGRRRGLNGRCDLVNLEIRSGQRRLGDNIHFGGLELQFPWKWRESPASRTGHRL